MFQPKLTDCCSDAVSCGILGTDLQAAHSYSGSCSEVAPKQTDLEGEAVEFFVGVLIEQSPSAELPLMDLLVSQSRASQEIRELVGEYAESGFVRFIGAHPDVFALENDTVSLRMKKSEEKPSCADRHKFVVPKSPPSASHVMSKDLAAGVVVQRTKSPFQDIGNRIAPQAKSGLVLKGVDDGKSAKVDYRSQSTTGTEQFKICEVKEAVSKVVRSAFPGTRRLVREPRYIPTATRPLCPEFSSAPQEDFVPLSKAEEGISQKSSVKRYSAEELYAIRDEWLRTNPPALALPPLDDEMSERYWTETCESFERMNLKEALLRGIYAHGLTKPNLVQQLTIMPCCSGEDVALIRPPQAADCGCVSLAVAILERIDTTRPSCQAVILAPNPAVSARITETVCSLGRYLNVSCVNLDLQSSKAGCNASELIGHVIVGTPSRLLELFDRMMLNVFAIKILALENTDEMFVYDCFLKTQIYGVFNSLPNNTQVLLSCSQLIPEVLLLTSEFMKYPIRVLVDQITWRRDYWQANRQPHRNSRGTRRSQSDRPGAPPPQASASSSSAPFVGSCHKRDERRAVDFFQAALASGFPEEAGAEIGRLFSQSSEAAWAVRRVAGNDVAAFARFLAAHPDDFVLDGETVRLRAATKSEGKTESADCASSEEAVITDECNNGVPVSSGDSSLIDDVVADNEFACLDDIDVATFVCDDKDLPPWLRGMTITVKKSSSPTQGLSPILPSSPRKCKAKVATKIAQGK